MGEENKGHAGFICSHETADKEAIKEMLLENIKNPLELSPVIRCVFQFLNIEDTKKCRYINKEWSSVGLLALKSRAQIPLRKDVEEKNGFQLRHDNTPARFFEVFPEAETSKAISFTAFKIHSQEESPWSLSDLNDFFQRRQNKIRELKIKDLYVVDKNGKSVDSLDITPWISGSEMTKSNTKYKTKLWISCNQGQGLEQGAILLVQVSALVNIKQLVVRECIIDLSDGIKMCPTELAAMSVKFLKNGNLLHNICINDVVNLSKMEKMELSNSIFDRFGLYGGRRIETKMSLNMGENDGLNLQYLSMDGIDVVNWKTCNWIVEQLVLCDMPFVERTEMKIKELFFHDDAIDLSVLPQTIEILKIEKVDSSACSISQSVNLPNLRSLYLNVPDNFNLRQTFSHLVNCPLVQLCLEGNEKSAPLEIPFSWIPKSVKKLNLECVKLLMEKENEALNLKKLVLNEFSDLSWPMIRDNLQNICNTQTKIEELVLNFHIPAEEGAKILQWLFHFLDDRQHFSIGRFKWYKKLSISGHPNLLDYVDKKSKYYDFKNQQGKAITIGEFHESQDAELTECSLHYGIGK